MINRFFLFLPPFYVKRQIKSTMKKDRKFIFAKKIRKKINRRRKAYASRTKRCDSDGNPQGNGMRSCAKRIDIYPYCAYNDLR